MELDVIKYNGLSAGRKLALSEDVFGIEPNDHAIYLDVKNIMANKRQGTHKSKQRNEITGSSKKLKKQKGTGGARAGNIKNPQFKGGGRIFGPSPRDYSFKLNKKIKNLARKSALSYKLKESAIDILEDFTFDSPNTKQYLGFLKNLKVDNKKTLLVLPAHAPNVYLSSRNIKNAKVIVAGEINTYDVLNADRLLLLESSLQTIDNLLTPPRV